MKKKILSLLLMVCMLVSAFAFSALAEGEEVETTPEEKDLTYIDLYVNEGLVALFDGFAPLTVHEAAPAGWTAVNLFGVEGYDDYVDPTTYATSFGQGCGSKWFRVDGGYQPIWQDKTNVWSGGVWLDISELGAILGLDSTYTVQETLTHNGIRPVVEDVVQEDGTVIPTVMNWSLIKKYGYFFAISGGRIGNFRYGGGALNGKNLDGGNLMCGVPSAQKQWGGGYTTHISWIGNHYTTKYATLLGDEGSNLNGYNVWNGDAVVERSITRMPVTSETMEDGSVVYTTNIKFAYQFQPWDRRNALANYKAISAAEADHMNTELKVAADFALYHSIRIYNCELNKDQRNQNHLADLVAYYGLDANYVADIAEYFGDAVNEFYAAFAHLTFKDSREDVVAMLDTVTAAKFATAAGTAIRNDMKADGLRYYVDVDMAALEAVMAAGTTVELGTLVSVEGETPVLDDYATWDYKVVGFDANGGKTGFFVDEDTYAVTIRYNNAGKAELKTDVTVRNYVKLTKADGESMIFYADASAESIYDVYVRMNDAQITNAVSGLWDYVFDRIAVAERK